jgi:hypothetical protein
MLTNCHIIDMKLPYSRIEFGVITNLKGYYYALIVENP